MHINIHKTILLKPLEQVSKALPNKTTVPILAEILIQVSDKGLTLIAGSIETSIKADIPNSLFEVIECGSITLPGKKITEIIKKMNDDITIQTNGTQVTIKSGKSKFELVGMNGDEYPEFPDVHGKTISLTGELMRTLVSKTIFATSDQQNLPILTGILFTISENEIMLTACDRHRLARVEKEIQNGIDFSVVISRESLNELTKMVADNEVVELSLTSDQFLAKAKQFTFFSRVLEGAYPDINKTIPTSFNSLVTVNRVKLIETLERVKIIADDEKNKIAKIIIGDEIEILAKVENRNVTESVEYESIDGEKFKVSLNTEYLLDALKAIDSKNAIIHYVTNMSPIVIKGEDDYENLQLVLPYKTD